MRRRVFIITGAGFLAAWSTAVHAQQQKISRIGFLALSEDAAKPELLDALRAGLRDHGYVDGQNVLIEYSFANGSIQGYPQAVMDLIALNVDVIIAWTTPAAIAAQKATSTIPILLLGVPDPVSLGLVQSLRRPGANITGLSNQGAELSGKLMEQLVTMDPGIRRLAVLYNPLNPSQLLQLHEIEAAGQSLGLSLEAVSASAPGNFDAALDRIISMQSQGVVVLADALFISERQKIADFAIKHKLATISQRREIPEAGGLMAYGADLKVQLRQIADYVDKILKGTNAGELPVEQPTKFELVINLKTANALGISVPPSMLAVADQVIE